MKVLILAAGEGKRLRPYTNEIPKCMVKLAGYPLLSYQLASIEKCNISIDDIALVGGYKMGALGKFNLKKFRKGCALNALRPKISFASIVRMSREELKANRGV